MRFALLVRGAPSSWGLVVPILFSLLSRSLRSRPDLAHDLGPIWAAGCAHDAAALCLVLTCLLLPPMIRPCPGPAPLCPVTSMALYVAPGPPPVHHVRSRHFSGPWSTKPALRSPIATVQNGMAPHCIALYLRYYCQPGERLAGGGGRGGTPGDLLPFNTPHLAVCT